MAHEDEEEIRLAHQGLRHLRAPIRMAQEMGQGLGRGALLLGKVQTRGMTTPLLPGLEPLPEQVTFVPTRAAGLARLDAFVGRAAQHYTRKRNHDLGPDNRSNVSALSPWLRHRLITEEDVLRSVLAHHSVSAAQKFVQEVFWRTYFKGWLEQRPSVWRAYQRGVLSGFETLDRNADLNTRYRSAVAGQTGIDCFDAWAKELAQTGYLHNHTRMWFASIWMFTLRLPWELGADFFLRHLLDGDPASNTLSWRWVAGLHTKGRTYLARPDNIARYTEGRFRPSGLSRTAEALTEDTEHPRVPIARSDPPPDGPYLLVLTEDDLCGAALIPHEPEGVIGVLATQGRSPQPVGAHAAAFAEQAMQSVLFPHKARPAHAENWAAAILDAAKAAGARTVVTPFAPIGPARARLDQAEPTLRKAGLDVLRVRRRYDSEAWPHAKAGYFGLKKKIPGILAALDLARPKA